MRRSRRLPLDALRPYLLTLDEHTEPLRWHSIFENQNPVEIEIGFGKGLFLITAAQSSPHTNFLGVEIERKYQLYAANRIAKRGLTNIRVVKADARHFMRDRITAASVQAIHIYYPDPWWKHRHQKRRLFDPDFVRQCERILAPGGRLHVVTDVNGYFLRIRQWIETCSKLQPLPLPEETAPTHDMDYLTNFERKFRKEGRPIFRCLFERTAPAPSRTSDEGVA